MFDEINALDLFENLYPRLADEMDTFYKYEHDELLIIVLMDGTAVKFDPILETIKYYPTLQAAQQSLNRLNPETEAEWRRAFSIKLYRLMRSYGYSLEELSNETGLSISSISKYINGITTPNAFNLLKIANVLGCTADYLIDL